MAKSRLHTAVNVKKCEREKVLVKVKQKMFWQEHVMR